MHYKMSLLSLFYKITSVATYNSYYPTVKKSLLDSSNGVKILVGCDNFYIVFTKDKKDYLQKGRLVRNYKQLAEKHKLSLNIGSIISLDDKECIVVVYDKEAVEFEGKFCQYNRIVVQYIPDDIYNCTAYEATNLKE